MIRYLIDDNQKLRIEQVGTSPTVYLDHWALRHISTTDNLRTQFVEHLLASGGTLMLSWLNLAEFTKVTDRKQAESAENLVNEILPNVFFIEIDPFTVIEREDKLLNSGVPIPPHADTDFLRAFSTLKPNKPNSVFQFTAHDLFAALHKSKLAVQMNNMADTLIDRIKVLREEMITSQDFCRLVRRLPSGPPIQHGTRYVLRELSRIFLIDHSLNITRNHSIDLLHSIVPVAYCDIVLLDAHWEEQVARMRDRLKEAKLNVPIASVFSRRTNGLYGFFSALGELHT
jgi:hypothetical protein